MRSIRFALLVLIAGLATLPALVSACGTLGIPAACRSVCEDSDAEPCQKCVEEEREKRAEARRKREEERRNNPPPSYPGAGASGGGSY